MSNGLLLILSNNGNVEIVDVKTGVVLQTFVISDNISSISISPNEKNILVSTGREIQKFTIESLNKIVEDMRLLYAQ